jgi:gamma-glutamyl-gamma-aminobutyrate hydrolase PuuD
MNRSDDMPFLASSSIQDPQDASLSDRLALWIAEQQQQHYPVQHARPRIGMLAPMGYARDGGWPVYAGDAPTAYAILEAGGFPTLIPALPLIEGFDPFHFLTDERAFSLLFGLIWPLMRELDGLILTGGGDLYSCLYGQTPHPQAETPDVWRDVWERYIAMLAWLLCIPTLGICRGMQLMNVVLGGTLYQDLRAQWPKERSPLLRHHARGRVSSTTWSMHPIHVHCPESRLALAVRGSGELDRHTIDPVLSMHHQAVETLAPDLMLSATSPDGVIEAFEETASARWWVGVQFHPEWMTHLTWSLGLFTALVEVSRSYSNVPRAELESSLEEIQGWLRQQDSMLLHLSASSTMQSGKHHGRQTSALPVSIERYR